MIKKVNSAICTMCLISLSVHAGVLYEDTFDNDGLTTNTGIGGGAANRTMQAHSWSDDGDATFNTIGTSFRRRALLYSQNTFQSDTGFKLTVNYTTGSIGDTAAHNFSFGLISSDTDLSAYTGYNPFRVNGSVYSIGANITSDGGTSTRGLNFADGSTVASLDESGTVAQFLTNASTEVVIEIGQAGLWSYSINGVVEASGQLPADFDLSKNYHVVVYGQDDNGGGKSIQSLKLEERIALGERADWMRGTWGGNWKPVRYDNGWIEGLSIEPFIEQISGLKTIDYIQLHLSESNSYSAVHSAPHDLLESLWQGDTDASGNPLNLVVPRAASGSDPFLDWLIAVKAAGMKTQVYVNSYNMLNRDSSIPAVIADVTTRWKDFCDTDTEAQAFLSSRGYHTDGVHDDIRPYMFCYAEFVLKDYAIRYGDLIDAWLFDSGQAFERSGDDATTGTLEDQRVFQAFADACHAGNPNAAISFNNHPNREAGAANGLINPYTPATLFCDYMFGHPYNGGDNIGKNKDEYLAGEYPTNYGRNYAHMLWMDDKNGYVHNNDGPWTWDDKVVGHWDPPMSTTSWNSGSTMGLLDEDFKLWNEVAMQGNGAMSWGLPLNRTDVNHSKGPDLLVNSAGFAQLQVLDAHLMVVEDPGAPNWARAETLLPDAIIGEAYLHVLVEGIDFWDPEGDAIDTVWLQSGAPSWLNIAEDPNNPGNWVLSGIPSETSSTNYDISLSVRDINIDARSRSVTLQVNESSATFTNTGSGAPVWASDPLVIDDAHVLESNIYYLVQGRDFTDFEQSNLTVTKTGGPSWVSISESVSGTGWWVLSITPGWTAEGLHIAQLTVSDGSNATAVDLEITVTHPQIMSTDLNKIYGGAYWTDLRPVSPGDGVLGYNNGGSQGVNRALFYSTNSYQSFGGFKLTAQYETGSIDDSAKHNLSFGLISTDTDLSSYAGYNPFASDTSVYSLGINVTADNGAAARGLNFTNASSRVTLDQSGTNVQFPVNQASEVVLEVGSDGAWTYSIDSVQEASGTIAAGFDITKNYHVAVYAQDDNGGGKFIHSLKLEPNPNYVYPVAHWALDDGTSSIALDSSGNGSHGTISNASSVTGVDGTALDFNGSSTEVTIPASAFASINNEITISMWVYGAANQPRSDSIFQAVDSSGNRVLNIHLPWSNSVVYWDAGWSSGAYDRINQTASSVQYQGSWSHWVFVKNATAGTMEIYHNGTLFHSGTGKTKSINGITNSALGSTIGSGYYSGSIDEVMLFDAALTAAEVLDLYDSY
ncbi:MAG: LamG domain-containing protein [Opitutaceae bacterium]